MSQSNSTTIKMSSEVRIVQGDHGTEFHAYNHERSKWIHFGTLKGGTVEKVQTILQRPEPSFSFTIPEIEAYKQTGARVVRIQHPDGTYSIDLAAIEYYGEIYYNAFYGKQLRIKLGCFQFSSAKVKRNAQLDNPVIPTSEPITERKSSWRNLDLFSR